MALTKVTYSMISGSPANVMDYGAVANNSTDNSTAIQAILDSGSNVIYFPYGTYLINTTLSVPANVTIYGPGTIHYTGSGHAIDIVGSNVTIDGLTIYGNYSATFLSGSIGIYCSQTSYSPSLSIVTTSNLKLTNNTIYNFGQSGIRGDWWSTFQVTNNYIHDCGQHGILITSPRYGKISENTIYNITPGQTNAGYGISLSRNVSVLVGGVTTYLTTAQAPAPTDCHISNNVISLIENYTAIDLHSGNNITIIGNTVQSCQVAVNLEHASSTGILVSVNNIVITGNSFYGVTTGTVSPAILIDAQSGLGEIAEGITISGNSFFNHGLSSGSAFEGTNGGVIYATSVNGVNITGNSFNTPRGRCVSIDADATNITITSNSVKDLALQNSIRTAFDLIDGSGQATINSNVVNAGGGYVAGSTTINTGKGLKVGADNIAYGGVTMADANTTFRIRGGGFITTPRLIVAWDGTDTSPITPTYTAFDNINYTSSDVTITKSATGEFTVTWPAGIFHNAKVCAAFSGADGSGSTVYNAIVTSSNATSASCKTFTSAGAGVNCVDNYLIVWGR